MDVYAVIFVSFLMVCGNFKYIREITKGRVVPTKSSWLIFSVVTGLNVSSFLATRFDVVSGAYGITDFVSNTVILAFALVYSSGVKMQLKSFEKYYLLGAAVCVLFWIISSNSFVTNLLAQALIVVGYFPTIHSILAARKSAESKFAWTIWTTGSLLSIYPALVNHNTLAIVYSLRGTILCFTVLMLTCKFQKRGD